MHDNIDLALDDFFASPLAEILAESSRLREKYFGRGVELCAIVNIRSGNCAMDCKFCAQSRHNSAAPANYPLLDNGSLLKAIEKLAAMPLAHIGLVASGAALGGEEYDRLLAFLGRLPAPMLAKICLSLGRLPENRLRELKAVGVRRYHHNLETSRDFYPGICSTQKWEDRYATALGALNAGLELCCGFLFGLGESRADRLNLALELKKAGIKNIPMNFLDPVGGTPFAQAQPVDAGEALRTIALYRRILPDATLRVCGGRLKTFGEKQANVFAAGANALMTGDFLTTRGNALENDLDMLRSAGLSVSAQA